MKTKLEMAHEWYMKHSESPSFMNTEVEMAWDYADAMQAEANKREQQKQDKLKQDQQNHHDELFSIGLEEWQPDWSVAPDGYDWFVVGGRSGRGFFCLVEPSIVKDHYWFVGEDSISADKHGYVGDWRDSLRKRPQ